MKTLTPDDHEMLERLITFCRAASVAADGKQAESARRVERFLAETRAQLPSPRTFNALRNATTFFNPEFHALNPNL